MSLYNGGFLRNEGADVELEADVHTSTLRPKPLPDTMPNAQPIAQTPLYSRFATPTVPTTVPNTQMNTQLRTPTTSSLQLIAPTVSPARFTPPAVSPARNRKRPSSDSSEHQNESPKKCRSNVVEVDDDDEIVISDDDDENDDDVTPTDVKSEVNGEEANEGGSSIKIESMANEEYSFENPQDSSNLLDSEFHRAVDRFVANNRVDRAVDRASR